MKAIILAGGQGSALQPLTDAVSKPMLKILNKPLVQYAIERLKTHGITSIHIVTNPKDSKIRRHFANGREFGVNISYSTQKGAGIEAAIQSAREFVENDEQFLLLHSDIICDQKIVSRTINAAESNGTDMALAVTLRSDVQDFGVVNFDASGYVSKIVSFGEEDKGNYVIAGHFLLSQEIFRYLDQGIAFNQCFNSYIKDGGEVSAGIWTASWFDIGRPWDILLAEKYLMEQMSDSIISSNAYIEDNVSIRGPVIIEPGVEILSGTIIKGPVYISRDAFIGNNSLIRENSYIGENARIGMGVEIKHAHIMDFATIARLSYVGSSLIGSRSIIHSGAITINSPVPKAPIYFEIQGEQMLVPMRKFGAVVGSKVNVGVNSSLAPGSCIESNINIDPNSNVKGRIKA